MKQTITWPALVCFSSVIATLSTGCGMVSTASNPFWSLAVELKRGSIGDFYPMVKGTITRKSASASSSGTSSVTRFYSDDYQTLISEEKQTLGADLAKDGSKEVDISSLSAYLKPASGCKAKICVEFKAEESNIEEFKKMGCLEGS